MVGYAVNLSHECSLTHNSARGKGRWTLNFNIPAHDVRDQDHCASADRAHRIVSGRLDGSRRTDCVVCRSQSPPEGRQDESKGYRRKSLRPSASAGQGSMWTGVIWAVSLWEEQSHTAAQGETWPSSLDPERGPTNYKQGGNCNVRKPIETQIPGRECRGNGRLACGAVDRQSRGERDHRAADHRRPALSQILGGKSSRISPPRLASRFATICWNSPR